jgi:hypothetical protein
MQSGTSSEGQVKIEKTTNMTATNGVLNGEAAASLKGASGMPTTTTNTAPDLAHLNHWQTVLSALYKSQQPQTQQANGNITPGAFAAAFPAAAMANPNAFAQNLYVNGGMPVNAAVSGGVNGQANVNANVNVLPAVALQMAAANGADPNFLNAAAQAQAQAQAQLVAQAQQVQNTAAAAAAGVNGVNPANFNQLMAAAAARNNNNNGKVVDGNGNVAQQGGVKRERNGGVTGVNGGANGADLQVSKTQGQNPSGMNGANGVNDAVNVNGAAAAASFAAINGALRHHQQVSKAQESLEESGKDGDEREMKKQRRKQSNRESARRSRLRKQAECEELSIRVSKLSEDNLDLQTELSKMRQRCQTLTCQNKVLQQELHSFASRKQQTGGNNNNNADPDPAANQTTHNQKTNGVDSIKGQSTNAANGYGSHGEGEETNTQTQTETTTAAAEEDGKGAE